MLHFPSANKSAHRSKQHDITRLNELLGDEVWAFSNCRVEAPNKPVAEIDWLFYNTKLGTLMVSEWKRYPKPVAQARDTGAKWVLEDGSEERNPVEQVSAQQDALRWALRDKIVGTFFPELRAHDLKVAQCVYCPQVLPTTVKDRLRFGRVYGTLEEMCHAVVTVNSPDPLLFSEMSAVKDLAKALGELLRCEVPTTLGEATAYLHNPKESAHFWQRASLINSQIASLHEQLAQLMLEEFAPQPHAIADPLVAQATLAASDETGTVPHPAAQAKVSALVETETEYPKGTLRDLVHSHATSFLPELDGQHELFVDGMKQLLVAILGDTKIPSDTWISLGTIGFAVKKHIGDGTGWRDLLGTQFWKWCLKTAEESGFEAEVDDVHQNIRVARGS